MRTVELSKIVNATEALKFISESEPPSKVSYWISRYLILCDREVKIYSDIKNKKIVEYGTPVMIEDADGKKIHKTNHLGPEYDFSEENGKKINEELDELLKVNVEIQFDKIALSAFGEKYVIKPKTLASLEWMIDGEL